MTPLHVPRIQHWLSGYVLCQVPEAGPRFALSIDDGPSPRNTPALLDALARSGARATFFLIARRIRRHPALVRRIVSDGHEVGIHGDLHLPAWAMAPSWLARDLEYSIEAATDALGSRPRHYRAPFGLLLPWHAERIRQLGLDPVLGSIYPRDHATRRSARIVRRVLSRMAPGAIVILHDGSAIGDFDRSATIGAVPEIVAGAMSQGLSPVTIASLRGGSPA